MVAKTAKTKKAKGSKAEHRVAERYRHWKVDETARRMPMSGAMAHFKSDIYKRFDMEWIDEVKCHETVRLGLFWKQTTIQAGLRAPVLHVTANYRPIITIIRENDFDAICGDDTRRFDRIDITRKKRFSFWDYASQCHDLVPRATVVDAVIGDDAVVMMTIDCYMQLRKEAMDAGIK